MPSDPRDPNEPSRARGASNTLADDPDDPIARLIPAPLRAALANRELLVRRPVAGARHGAHRSLRPGVGRDFRDYRPYVPGDDPRRLDWRAAARSQRLVIRQTESEEELDLVLLLDGSGGMAYGRERGLHDQKWRRAGTVAAALTSLALRQGDRVGFAVGRDGATELAAIEPVARRDRLRTIADMFASEASGDCPWPSLLEAVAPRLRRRALVVVISDFLDPGGEGAGVRPDAEREPPERNADESLQHGLTLLRTGGHDVALVQVLHRDELEFPWDQPRVLELEDLRARRPTIEGAGTRMRAGYLERLHAHLRWLEQSCERGGLLLARVVTDEDPAAQLLELLGRLAGVPTDAVSHDRDQDQDRGPA
ncbi:putative CONSERVED MEMBRANE PROTEIN [Enhygromyxa salina]|uniref:Putative CONSERVED MEMBRANE PROTEIN n=1 Tax=Enhygromyxa salina TaxID=215803 RepID=A0A0C1ZA42_9BACT|nr:DUF58 domain-containing protein [Enhygromyxa salina]KIG14479.1 putative CONSERVED MEMBRANE PROTEIN [Enhygromyxa salina]